MFKNPLHKKRKANAKERATALSQWHEAQHQARLSDAAMQKQQHYEAMLRQRLNARQQQTSLGSILGGGSMGMGGSSTYIPGPAQQAVSSSVFQNGPHGTGSATGNQWAESDLRLRQPLHKSISVENATNPVTLYGGFDYDPDSDFHVHRYQADLSYSRAAGSHHIGPGDLALLPRLSVTHKYSKKKRGVFWYESSEARVRQVPTRTHKKPLWNIGEMEATRKVHDICKAYNAMDPRPFVDAMDPHYVKMFWEKLANSIESVSDTLVVRELSKVRCMYRGLPNETASMMLRSATNPITINKMNEGYTLINQGLLLRIPPVPQFRKTRGALNLSGLQVLINWSERPDFKRFFDCFIPDPTELERTIMSNQVEAKMKTGFWADDWR